MAKYMCSVCGFVHEGMTAPEKCPICLTSASDFTIIENVSDETPQEESNAGDVVSSEPENNNVEIATDNVNSTFKEEIDPVEKAIIDKFQETHGLLQVVKWYKETYDVGLKEAKDRVEEVLIKNNLWNMDNSGSGCAVTLLIAITSTLSLFWIM